MVLPEGFTLHGVHAGIKSKNKLDMGLIYSSVPCEYAGVFTTNRFAAAPVLLCQSRMHSRIQAVLVNSGHANAFTGDQGKKDAFAMADSIEEALRIPNASALVFSTGKIGTSLPMESIQAGIKALARQTLEQSHTEAFAQAICTTDRFIKHSYCEFELSGKSVRLYGVAKGAGMIEPNMATMLAFFITDMSISESLLQEALEEVTQNTFNAITVDGEQSTNDSVIVLANGCAGNPEVLGSDDPGYSIFRQHLGNVAFELAKMIVKDGEGATKFIEICVKGALNDSEAKLCAYKLANSLLIKTAFFGNQINWGRFVSAIGACPIQINEAQLDISLGGHLLIHHGKSQALNTELHNYIQTSELYLEVNLNVGKATRTVYTCDLSEEYVRINSTYLS